MPSFHAGNSTFRASKSTFHGRKSTFHASKSTFHGGKSTFFASKSTFRARKSTFFASKSTFHGGKSPYFAPQSTFLNDYTLLGYTPHPEYQHNLLPARHTVQYDYYAVYVYKGREIGTASKTLTLLVQGIEAPEQP
ncbi:MAG: hypothetical protein LBK71_03970 [Verrucomicrobiales bacterium]|jgi:hypothetical protein|nr:hypothetical protein [Verrucomicrobiales bacterium]